MKYRKKPVVIEAVKASELLNAAANEWQRLPEWIVKEYNNGNIVFARGAISIHTLEGTMLAEATDWVILGVKGEIYPCKPDIFEATYEEVE